MTLMSSLFKNRNYLYFIVLIAFVNVVGFASVQRNDMVILYCLLGVILYRFTKNVSLLLTITVVLVNSMAVLQTNYLLNEYYYQNKEALQAYNKVEYNCIKDMNYINNKNTKNTENGNGNGSENTEDDDTNSSTELINKIKKQLEKAQRKQREKEKKKRKNEKKEKKEKIVQEIEDATNQVKKLQNEEDKINMEQMKETFMQ